MRRKMQQFSLMRYTAPESEQQKRLYSQFAGLLSALTYGRWLVQYGIWLPVATIALARLCNDYLGQYIAVGMTGWFVLAALVCAGLHWLLSQSYKTHWFHRWDANPFTNDGLFLPIALAISLWFLDYKALQHSFTGTIAVPVATSEAQADSLYNANLATATAEYNRMKAETEGNLASQLALLEPSLQSEIARWEKVKPRTTADRDWKRKQLRELNARLERSPKAAKAKADAATRLDGLLTEHNATLSRLELEKATQKKAIQQGNEEGKTAYLSSTKSASTYAGLISVFCALVFFYCARRQVRIMTWCGMFPKRYYNELGGHGNSLEKLAAVLADVASRLFHKFIAWLHEFGSAGEITNLDDRLNIKEGNYQQQGHNSPKQTNGHHYPTPNGLGKTLPHQ